MNTAVPLPLDVRLMNATASLAVAGLVLACLVALLLWVLRNPVFAIGHIVVTGDTTHNSAASLRTAVMPRLTGNFFSMDLEAAQQAFQSVPWVRKAVVQREFPGQLHVHLQEHVAVAQWGEGDTRLVNTSGEVFEVATGDADEQALPRLSGPEGQAAAVLAMFRELSPALQPMGARMTALELGARGEWQATLDRGARVELGQGTPQELEQRLRRFALTVRDVAARHQRGVDAIEAADLRHLGGYALRLRGISTVRVEANEQPAAPAAPARR